MNLILIYIHFKAFREVPLFVGVGIIYGILMILFPTLSTWLPGWLS